MGNLTERVPQLFFYHLFTYLAIIVLVLLLGFTSVFSTAFPKDVCVNDECVLAIEYSCWIFHLVLHVLGLFHGYLALRRTDMHQLQRFYLLEGEHAKSN